MSQAPQRLPPTPQTVRALYLKSGNLCAYPGCSCLIINTNGTYIGEICHIEAASSGGPRFNTDMTDDERRHEDNLILLCRNHHTEIDRDINKYTVPQLREMKKKHESKFLNPEDRILDHFRDKTANCRSIYPSNINKFLHHIYPRISKEEEKCYYEILKENIGKFSSVPIEIRVFIANFANKLYSLEKENRGESISGMYHYTELSDIMYSFRFDDKKMKEIVSLMKRYELGDIDTEYDNWNTGSVETIIFLSPISAFNKIPGDEWNIWMELAKFCDDTEEDLEKMCRELDFNALQS